MGKLTAALGGKGGKLQSMAAGRFGGKLAKIAAPKQGHQKQTKTPVATDRGAFQIKG